MKRILLFALTLVMLTTSYAFADVLSSNWQNATVEELEEARSLIDSRLQELTSETISSETTTEEQDENLVTTEVSESSFIKDMSNGLTARWNKSGRDTSLMSEVKVKEYFTELVMYELEKLAPYSSIEFTDKTLGKYANAYISALQDQFIAITEYYGEDEQLYHEYWDNAYRKRTQMIYWINKKYGLDIPARLNDTFKEMINVGYSYDMDWTVQETLTKQLTAIDLPITKSKSNYPDIGAFTLTNETSYSISWLSIELQYLDENGNVINSSYLYSGNNISPKGAIHIQKTSAYVDSFSKIRFAVTMALDSGVYYEQTEFFIVPEIQYSWINSTIKRNGEIASGQPILEIEGITTAWDYNKSWSQTLYVPQIKFSIKNTGAIAAETVTVHCVFKNKKTDEVWDEETVYVVGYSDAPLNNNASKKVFVYSSVGYKTKPTVLPDLCVDIYINDVLVKTIDSIRQ